MFLKAPTAARSRGGKSATGSQLPPLLEGGGGLVTAAAEWCATIQDDVLVVMRAVAVRDVPAHAIADDGVELGGERAGERLESKALLVCIYL